MKKAFVLAIAMLLAISGVANAAKPTTTITYTPPIYGERFVVSVTTDAPRSLANLLCYQNGQLVYSSLGLAHYTTSWTESTILKSAAWASGAAECVIRVKTWNDNFRMRVIGETTFTVGA